MQSALLKHEVSEIRVLYESAGIPHTFTAKTQYRKFETNISRKGMRSLSPNFHIHASVSDLYIPTIGLTISATGKYVDRSWEYLNRSQTHEC
jgi:hypothetical protein